MIEEIGRGMPPEYEYFSIQTTYFQRKTLFIEINPIDAYG
jgi:hypothetical protein